MKYIERLNNGDIDNMKYKHYGKLHKHCKSTRDYWSENMSRAIYLWNKRGVMKMYKDCRKTYDLSTSAMLVRNFAMRIWVESKLRSRA